MKRSEFTLEVLPEEGTANLGLDFNVLAINNLEIALLLKSQVAKTFSNRFYATSRTDGAVRVSITTDMLIGPDLIGLRNLLITTLQDRPAALKLHFGDDEGSEKTITGRYVPQTLSMISVNKRKECNRELTFQFQGIMA